MIDYVKMAKEVAKAIKEDDKLFSEFVSNYSEVMLLDKGICEKIVEIINTNGDCEFYYCLFNTEYDVDFLKNFATNTKYIIDHVDEYDYSVYLTQDGEDVEWMPVIFIKEFWDFYSNYDHTIKEEETKIETTKTDIEIIADNLIEYIDKIQDIITNFTNMGLPKEDISFIIQKAILSWTEN